MDEIWVGEEIGDMLFVNDDLGYSQVIIKTGYDSETYLKASEVVKLRDWLNDWLDK